MGVPRPHLSGEVSDEVSDASSNSRIYESPVIEGNDMPFCGDVRHSEGEDSKNPIQHGVVKGLRGSKVWPSQHRCQVFIPFDPEDSGQLKRPRVAWISITSSLTFLPDRNESCYVGPVCIVIGLSGPKTRSRCTGTHQ